MGCEHRSVPGCNGTPIAGAMAHSGRCLHSLFLSVFTVLTAVGCFFSPKGGPDSIPTTPRQRR